MTKDAVEGPKLFKSFKSERGIAAGEVAMENPARRESFNKARAGPIPVNCHGDIPLRRSNGRRSKISAGAGLALILDPRGAGAPDRSKNGEAKKLP